MVRHITSMIILVISISFNVSAGGLDAELVKKSNLSIDKGVKFLMSQQRDEGSWASNPAITGLCIIAILDSPGVNNAINSGLDYILKFAKPDGSIWSKNVHAYPNYTTSISMLALASFNRPKDLEVIKKARNYLINSQFNDRKSIDFGGIGYSKTGRADITNLSYAVEALHFTEYLDQEPYSKKLDAVKQNREMWEKVQIFITSCQNLPEMNKQDWVSRQDNDYGGFVYRPTESKAGSITDETGKVSLLSSGSVSYSGLLSMIYANMDINDYRVRGVMDYISRHYTLKENPGMGQQGLYFYLNVLTKALNAYNKDEITEANGTKHNWCQEILNEFIVMQKPEGYWVNDNSRYLESMPELATSYGLTAMKIALNLDQ